MRPDAPVTAMCIPVTLGGSATQCCPERGIDSRIVESAEIRRHLAGGVEERPGRLEADAEPAKTAPWAASSTVGIVRPWRSTKARIWSVLPYQAIPITGIWPVKRRLASSTEGASRLQELQPGDQNHNAAGPSPMSAPSVVAVPSTRVTSRSS